jgi:HPt (histidine-containing phosphotransfer) domain-containing protein
MINWTKFNEYLGELDREWVIANIVDGFIDGKEEQMLILKKNVEERDFPLVHRNAHTLKTHCATFGDFEAKELAFKLEIMGKEKRDEDMNGVYNELAKAVEDMIIDLKKYKNTPPSRP